MADQPPHVDPLVKQAAYAYHHDPFFHAKVERAVVLLDEDLHAQTGTRLDDGMVYIARHAAALALMVDEGPAVE